MLSFSWRYRRFHVSFIFGWLAAGILLGLSLGRAWPVLGLWVWLILGGLLLPACILQKRWWSVILALLAGLLIGWQRGSSEMVALSAYQHFVGETQVITGTITDDPEVDDHAQTVFSLGSIRLHGQPLKGRVYASVTGRTNLKRDDTVVIRGKVRDGFGSYQASVTYADVVATSSGRSVVRDIREHFSRGVRATVMEPESSLGLGFVVGQRSSLPATLDDQLKIVGLTHIVVASGYNLTILVRFARRLFAKYSRYMAVAVSSGLVLGFIAFSGMTPSMIRAGAVTLLSLLAWYYGRRFHPLLLIAFVAAGSAYWDPIYLWGDIGWYLSFLAFIGVLIVAPLVTARLLPRRKPSAIVQLLIETLSATIMTLPLILLTFERLPVLTLLANMLVAPIIPWAMLATTVAGVAGMIAPAALTWLGLPATIIIGYAVWVVHTLSSISWARIDLTMPIKAMIGSYLLIVVLVGVWWRKTKYRFLSSSVVE